MHTIFLPAVSSFGKVLFNRTLKSSYKEAHKFVLSLGLKKQVNWRAWLRNDVCPDDIPHSPDRVYKNKGWTSWGEWLGTGRIANQSRKYRSFQEARVFVRNLKLPDGNAWGKWVKSDECPDDIPANPYKIYKGKGWVGIGDWLGTDSISTRDMVYLPFEDARLFVQNLGLQNQKEWLVWARSKARPKDIPISPHAVYKNDGWSNLGDWLGSGRVDKKHKSYRSFQEARVFVHSLGLKNQIEWRVWARSELAPSDIPCTPNHIYKNNGWISWSDWLGTRNRKVGFCPFIEARRFVQSLNLKNKEDWNVWSKSNARPDTIPVNPTLVYKKQGWISWGDWLGTGRIAPQNMVYRSFAEARTFAHSMHFKNQVEWREWGATGSKPNDIPAYPDAVYKNDGWAGWGDWLGIVNRWNRNAILSFLNGIQPVLKVLQPSELYSITLENLSQPRRF